MNADNHHMARYWFITWLSGFLLPCLVIFAAALMDWLGVFIPAGSPWPMVTLLAVALALMLAGTFLTDMSIFAKIAVGVLTMCLFPCWIVLFTFAMMRAFGFTKT